MIGEGVVFGHADFVCKSVVRLDQAGPDDLSFVKSERHFAAALGRFRLALCGSDSTAVAMSLPPELDEAFCELAATSATITEELYAQLQRHFVLIAPELEKQRREIDRLRANSQVDVETTLSRAGDLPLFDSDTMRWSAAW